MRKLRIFQINHMFLDGGGREEHIFYISKELIQRGHDVSVITSDYMASGEPLIGRKARQIPGFKIITLKGYQTQIPPGRILIPDLMETLLKNNNVDVIHAHGMGEQVAQDAFYAAKIKGVPFVFTPHFHPWWSYEKLHAQRIWKVLQETQLRMIAEHSDALISVSETGQKDFIKYVKYKGKNMVVIPNGLDPDLKIPSKEEIRAVWEKFKIPPNKKYLIFLGSVTNPRKGALEAVQVFRQVREKMPDAHMLVVGPWSSRYISTTPVLKIVEKLAKAKHVTVTGYVSESDKYSLLAGADVMVSPTVYEAFGITLAEALYCKIPVVATKVGGVPYVIRDKIDGFLIKEQTNIPAFARACLRLLRNPELAKKMGQAGHERVKRKFQWDKVSQKLEELYYRVIERNQKKK